MQLLIVTGISGAGKSCALAALADSGFYCVDNLPSALLSKLIELCMHRTPQVNRVAVVIDARESLIEAGNGTLLAKLDALQCSYEILFLDCKDEVIKRRYNETRRKHPISEYVGEGIAAEREFLSTIRERANYIVDTTALKSSELRHELMSIAEIKMRIPFSLIIQSFGYKNGAPAETDMAFDMRFLANPYYEPELRGLSGLDKPIADYLYKDPHTAEFLDTVENGLRRLIPLYINMGKHRLMVSFGCTGGRHRSVFAAQSMYERLKDFSPLLIHRDMALWTPNYDIK